MTVTGFAFALLDLVLLFGLTARLTLFVVSDDLGKWLIRDPAMKWVGNSMRPDQLASEDPDDWGWRYKLASGLWCPYCVGFWIGCLTLVSLVIVRDYGQALDSWRIVSGVFTLNLLTAPLVSMLTFSEESEVD